MTLAPRDPRHGTYTGYRNHGCRCDRCRKAGSAYNLAWRHGAGYGKPLDQHLAEVRAEAEARDNHGTETRYKLGCRCDACKTAANEARRRRRQTPNVKVHNRNGYCSGCRCDVCREGQRAYKAGRRAARTAA